MLNLQTAASKAATHTPGERKPFDKTLIPAGTYNFIIKEVEWNDGYVHGAYGKNRKAMAVGIVAADPSVQPGKALHCVFEVADGNHAGRLLFDDFIQECASNSPQDRLDHAAQEAEGASKVLALAFYARVTNDELMSQGVSVFANKVVTVAVTQWKAQKNYIKWELPKDGGDAPAPVVNTARPIVSDEEPPF